MAIEDFLEELAEFEAEGPALWEIGNLWSEPVKDEQQLLDLLNFDTGAAYKRRAVFLAGHFPLFYNENGAYAETKAWGAFTPYSLDLACRTAKVHLDLACWLSSNGLKGDDYNPKDIKFILLADDINYENFGENAKYSRHQKSNKRNAFYKSMSGKKAQLPIEFQEIFDKYNIPTNLIIRQNHEKKGREDCLFFSERILRTSRAEIENECAKAYQGLIGSKYFNKETDCLVAFLPDMCTGNVCERVLDDQFWKKRDLEFNGVHISMQTDSTLLSRADVESIWKDWGVKYRRDNFCV